jgi:dihydroorotate dehydrogenase (fumarate)
MADLRTRYLGLDLASPLVASASPLTGSLDGLRRLEDAGAAAVVLPSLFQEQLALEADQVGRLLEAGAGSLSTALSLDDYNAGPSGYLALVEKARASLEVPVIASLNGVAPGAWVEHAGLLEEAGADALELNVYAVSSSPGVSGAEVEGRYVELVGAIRRQVGIPHAGRLPRPRSTPRPADRGVSTASPVAKVSCYDVLAAGGKGRGSESSARDFSGSPWSPRRGSRCRHRAMAASSRSAPGWSTGWWSGGTGSP